MTPKRADTFPGIRLTGDDTYCHPQPSVPRHRYPAGTADATGSPNWVIIRLTEHIDLLLSTHIFPLSICYR